MTTLSLRFPGSLRRGVKELAKREGLSIYRIFATAVAEKLSALLTEDYIEERAARRSCEQFEAALANAPEVEPDDEQDRLD